MTLALLDSLLFKKVWWPFATLWIHFSFHNRYIRTSFIHKHSLRPNSVSSQLSTQWAESPWGAVPRFEIGPALQQASALHWANEQFFTLKYRIMWGSRPPRSKSDQSRVAYACLFLGQTLVALQQKNIKKFFIKIAIYRYLSLVL